MASVQVRPALVVMAHELSSRLLAYDPVRLAHVRGAARHAQRVAAALPDLDGAALVAAAMVHDIGYSPTLAVTGFHPVDGAIHLQDSGWPDSVVGLVAQHSYAAMTAPYYGVVDTLATMPLVHGRAADALAFADVSSGRDGLGATPEERIDDMRRRHGYDAVVPEDVRERRYRLLLAAADRVTRELAGRGGLG